MDYSIKGFPAKVQDDRIQKESVAAKMQGDRKALPLKAEYLPIRKVGAENGTSDYSIKGFPAKMQGDRKTLPLIAEYLPMWKV